MTRMLKIHTISCACTVGSFTVDDTNVYDFAWKTTGERSYGIVAQEAYEVYPAAVAHMDEHDTWGIDYSKYVPVILQELKALRARVAELEGKLEAGATPA